MDLPPVYGQSVDVLRGELESARTDPEQAHLNAATFLFWVVALDDTLRWRNKGTYTKPRSAAVGTDTFHGLSVARNALAHGAIVAGEPAGLTIPFTVPVSIPPARWRMFEEISSWPGRRAPSAYGVAAYKMRLEGQPVRDFMELTLPWFESLA